MKIVTEEIKPSKLMFLTEHGQAFVEIWQKSFNRRGSSDRCSEIKNKIKTDPFIPKGIKVSLLALDTKRDLELQQNFKTLSFCSAPYSKNV